MTALRSAWDLLRAGRPHYLLAGFLFYALGALTVQPLDAIDGYAFWSGQAFVTLTQWMVHYQNDFHDRHGDRVNPNRTMWSGSSGVLAEGWLAPAAVKWTGRAFAAAALAAAVLVLFVFRGGAPVAVVMTAIFLLSVAYSVPPWRLQERGWGPLVIMAVVPLGLPLLGAGLQAGSVAAVLRDNAPLAFLVLGAVLLLDPPDVEADRRVGKRTPAVRWGTQRVLRLSALAVVLAYAVALAVHPFGHSAAGGVAMLASLPLGAALVVVLLRAGPSPSMRHLTGLQTGALLLAGGTSLLQAALLLTPLR